jgi:hypothetical protein
MPSSHGWNWLSGRAHEAGRRVADLGVVGDVDQVAAGGEFAAAGQAIAVYLGDHRFVEVPDLEPTLHDMARPLVGAAGGVVGLVDRVVGGQIVTGAERRAGAAQDRDLHRWIGVGFLEGGED